MTICISVNNGKLLVPINRNKREKLVPIYFVSLHFYFNFLMEEGEGFAACYPLPLYKIFLVPLRSLSSYDPLSIFLRKLMCIHRRSIAC